MLGRLQELLAKCSDSQKIVDEVVSIASGNQDVAWDKLPNGQEQAAWEEYISRAFKDNLRSYKSARFLRLLRTVRGFIRGFYRETWPEIMMLGSLCVVTLGVFFNVSLNSMNDRLARNEGELADAKWMLYQQAVERGDFEIKIKKNVRVVSGKITLSNLDRQANLATVVIVGRDGKEHELVLDMQKLDLRQEDIQLGKHFVILLEKDGKAIAVQDYNNK